MRHGVKYSLWLYRRQPNFVGQLDVNPGLVSTRPFLIQRGYSLYLQAMSEKNKLGLFSLTMIVIGLVIGTGIFRTSKDAANAAATPTIFFAAWIVAGLVAICGALTYAEIGSRYPITGGYYKIFSYAYHPSLAFGINIIILISNAASLSGVALIGSEYITPLLVEADAVAKWKPVLAVAAIVLFYGVNLLGLRMSSQTQNVLMVIKIGMLLVIVAALFFPSVHSTAPVIIDESKTSIAALLLSFGVALKATSFTYGGYQQTINFGDEVQNPQKNIPKGIFIGIIVIIILYLLVSYSYVKVIGFNNLKETSGIASVVAEKMFGAPGKYGSSVLLFLAVLAYVNVLLLSNPRVMYAMSVDGILPKAFSKKDEKKDVLTVSLTVFAAICVVVLFFADTFDRILSFVIFLDSIGMATSAATIFVLRKRTKHLDGTGIYSMKFYPLLPLIFIAAYIFVGTMIAVKEPMLALTGTAVLAGFIILYFAAQRLKKNNQ
ncbi:MAG TPA: APC family permease [Chitinophagaceae bacterium]|jgi:APA family basic amino acid/polyamine antiporter|nr:APC family permease [Chitinophagaceae bacterium]HMU58474.1 APC family permease [Chitinophagaceae bacterium]